MTLLARTLWAGLLFLVGQAVLLALGSWTRASGTFVTTEGIALISPDSRTYLSIAGSPSEILSQPWTRWAYPFLLYVVELTGFGLSLLVVLQAIALVLATVLLHTMTAEAAGERSGLIVAAIMLANPLVAQWVRFALTESLMLTGLIVAMWFATRPSLATERTSVIGLIAVGVLLSMLRPNGVLVLGAGIAVVVATRSRHSSRSRRLCNLATVWAATGVLVGASAVVSGPPGEGSITSQLYGGVVIEGTAEVRTTINMPEAADADDERTSAAIEYALSNPAAVTRLALTRIVVELAQVRPHYPTVVNAAIGIAMALLLAAFVLGASDPRAIRLREVGLTFALPLLILIGATFAVPEGRYGWVPLVALLPLAGAGTDRALSFLQSISVERRPRD